LVLRRHDAGSDSRAVGSGRVCVGMAKVTKESLKSDV
jgi:hypothetical protein